MEYNIEYVKGKGLGTKDMDIGKFYIWVVGSRELGKRIVEGVDSAVMKLKIRDTELPCYLGDSTTPYRGTQEGTMLVQLMVDIEREVVGAMLSNTLILIIE